MIRGIHRFKIYTEVRHHVTAIVVVILPLLTLLAIGTFHSVDFKTLFIALSISFYRLFLGYVLSLILGVSIAIFLGDSQLGDAVMPVLDVLQNVPSFALIPLFGLMFGYTDLMAIIFVATSVIWPILFYTLSSLRMGRTDWNEAATIFGARGFKRLLHYTLPLSLPAIVTGSIVGISIGWEAVIGVEIIGFSSGIGLFLTKASTLQNHTMLVAGMSILLIFVFMINRLVWAPLLQHTRNYGE